MRHFVDGFPLFLSDKAPGVTFCYINDGQFSNAAFRSYLCQYHRLFRALGPVMLSFVTQEQHVGRITIQSPRRFSAASTSASRNYETGLMLNY